MTSVSADTDLPADESAEAPAMPSRWQRLRRRVASLLWLGVLTTVAWLTFAFVYRQDLRASSAPIQLLNCIAFAGQVLVFHLGLACLAAALLGLVLRRWRLALVAVVVALVPLGLVGMSYLPKSPPPVAGETLRIHSINILFANNEMSRIREAIAAADADVLLFQEWHEWHEAHVAPELAERYPHHRTFAHPLTSGMAIFSRYPILEGTPEDADVRLGENGMRAQRVVLAHADRPVAIYNIHPQSPGRPGALLWGQRQTADLIDALADEPLPHIVGGDFNASVWTANLAALRETGLSEVHELAGRGPGWTWPRLHSYSLKHRIVRHLPAIRIDHVFLSRELSATHAEVGQYHGSDHLSVVADIGWRQQ